MPAIGVLEQDDELGGRGLAQLGAAWTKALGRDPPEVFGPEAGLAPVQVERASHLLRRRPLVAGLRIVEAAGVGGDRAAVQPRGRHL